MSELIDIRDNRATIRWKLLTTASALALTAYVSSSGLARAEDSDNPQLWIELGGQAELMQGFATTFTAPFMYKTPIPDLYKHGSPIENQRPPRFAFGGDGKISFQPEDSSWIFSAAVRYGRSHVKRHVHHQALGTPPFTLYGSSEHKYTAPFVDTQQTFGEKHAVLDFSAGKDVGLGMFGRHGTSTISAGVRFAQFSSNSALNISARPTVHFYQKYFGYFHKSIPTHATWDQYQLSGHAKRSFKGVGPSLSWNASAALAGDPQAGEITLDWGVTLAALFGKQKAKTDHATVARNHNKYYGYQNLYPPRNVDNVLRSRSVTIPNAGGFVGLSYRYVDAKISFGYRGDVFFKAVDRGIDARKTSNLTFNGPYASISIGLGD